MIDFEIYENDGSETEQEVQEVVEAIVVEDDKKKKLFSKKKEEHVCGTVIVKRLNIRKKADIDSEVLCVVEEGESLDIIANLSDGWSRVNTKSGIRGFAKNEFIEE